MFASIIWLYFSSGGGELFNTRKEFSVGERVVSSAYRLTHFKLLTYKETRNWQKKKGEVAT